MHGKDSPTLVIYWADNFQLLNYQERHMSSDECVLVSMTPTEVLLDHKPSGRKIVIRGTLDPFAPSVS